MKILIVGQNPKTRRNIKEPFVGTKSYDVLTSWLSSAGIPMSAVRIINASNKVGKVTQKDVNRRRLKKELEAHKYVVTLGNYAKQATISVSKESLLSYIVLCIPHPSGLNRQLNNIENVRIFKEGLVQFRIMVESSYPFQETGRTFL